MGAGWPLLGVHHGHGIRWSGWKDDARLLDGLRLLEWLATRGVDGPLTARREAERQQQEKEAARRRWVERMPGALRAWAADRWQRVVDRNDVRDAVEAVASAFPDSRSTITALFEWFGAGRGRWTGFPIYEQLPERLLLAFPIESLLEAAEAPDLPGDALEGAARLFAGHAFADRDGKTSLPLAALFADQQMFVPQRTAAPLDILSPSLLRRLREYAVSLDDEDKRQRTRSAFGDQA